MAKKTTSAKDSSNTRLTVQKTYKMFINGAFPRSESGRYYTLADRNGGVLANVCRASVKDTRNAVTAALKAQGSWQSRSAYNRSQIVYRMAEMLELRRSQFVDEMTAQGLSESTASEEFEAAVDALVYFAGWCDKYQQVYSSVNPVASSHFNFSLPEPTGVTVQMAPENRPLTGLIEAVIPAIVGGNSSVCLASNKFPLTAISFAEVLATSDLPGGVINILTGFRDELLKTFASHMAVNAIAIWNPTDEQAKQGGTLAAENVKRFRIYNSENQNFLSPVRIMDFQEIKTTWHPVENVGGSAASY